MVRGAGARTDLSADELPADCRRPLGMWMRRALERQGFRVIDSRLAGQVIDVEVVAYDSDEEVARGLNIGVVERHLSDIGSLIAQIANTRSQTWPERTCQLSCSKWA